MGSRPGLRRGRLERVAGWLVTGPLGHLWSMTVDALVLLARYVAARARGRTPGSD